MQRVGILGSGEVGQTLAAGFLADGHEVQIGTRSPAKLADFSKSSGIAAGPFADVAAWGELLVLCVAGTAAEAVLRSVATAARGKIVIDTTNPIGDDPPVDGVLTTFTGPNESLLERLQVAAPELRLVKAFNSVGSARMVKPVFKEGRPTMFICGNDPEARKTVSGILDRFEWDTADLGTARSARAIEPLAMLWCIPGFRDNSWTHAFKVLWS